MATAVSAQDVARLESKAKEIRRSIVRMISNAGSGHPGGSLSAADLAVALYYHEMRASPKNPRDPGRDIFIMSKGHACPLQYAILADLGYFPGKELEGLRKINSMLQGHPSAKTPGIEVATGCLGQGLGVANGFALAFKLDGKQNRVYVILGDGELQEGSVWEAVMTSGHHKLDNLLAVVDNNGLQIDGEVAKIKNVQPIAEKFRAFGWNAVEVNGHDFGQILGAFETARGTRGKPTVVVAKTVKGKGVSFMENVVDFHGKAPGREEMEKALKELE